jgi:geranylgeranyl reductase family protein
VPRTSPAADIAIVGAGPSGAWTAWRLATNGVRVLLFDPSHPREKPCGGGVTGRALSLVRAALVTNPPAVPIRTVRFHDGRGAVSAAVPLALDGRDLSVCSRRAFDGALLDAARDAGATFVAERIAGIERSAGGFELHAASRQRYFVEHVVGADGPNGLVRRRMSRRFERAELSIATGFFAHGVTSEEVVVAFVDTPPGYIWSFPRPDHLAIGICAQADADVTPEALRGHLRRWMTKTQLVPAMTELEPYSWPIPSLTARHLRSLEIAGPGWLLVGDAAGLVDPITREGIFFALRSADLAADALLSMVGAPEAQYDDRVRREILPELARAARLKSEFFRPQFTRLLVHAVASSPAVSRIMAGLIAGTQTYAGLKWRLLSTLEWQLAWRLLRLEHSPRGNAADYLAR